jgi:hypothetical protein
MTTNARDLFKTFDNLPEAEQREAAAEILRRILAIEFPPIDDNSLVECAEELFLSFDRKEACEE